MCANFLCEVVSNRSKIYGRKNRSFKCKFLRFYHISAKKLAAYQSQVHQMTCEVTKCKMCACVLYVRTVGFAQSARN